mgnify:FL=1
MNHKQDTVRGPLGVIPLEECRINVDGLKVKRTHTFELFSPKIDKTFYIQANSADEMKSWLDAINNARNFYTVSAPTNVSHTIHVDFTAETGFRVRISIYFSSYSPYLKLP